MKSWKRCWVWGLAVVVALTGSGCGAVLGEVGRPEIPDDPPPVTALAQLKPPLHSYMLDGDKVVTLINGQQVLAVRCARKFGYQGEPTVYPLNSQPSEYAGMFSRRYGFVSLEYAKKYGYMSSPEEYPRLLPEDSVPAPDYTAREREILEGRTVSDTPSAIVAADGTPLPKGGCFQEAVRQLDPSASALRQLVLDGMSEASNQMETHPRARTAEKAYVQCMHGRGYPQLTGMGEQALYSGEPDGPEAIRAAVDDVTCAQEVNLPGTLYALDVAYQQRWIAKHEAELRQGVADREAALRRAQQAIAEGV